MAGGTKYRKWEAAAAALLTEPTVEAAARSVGVCHRTLKTWLQDDAFKAVYADVRRRAVDGALANLQGASAEAVQVLRAALHAEKESDRIRAAAVILDRALNGHGHGKGGGGGVVIVLNLAEQVTGAAVVTVPGVCEEVVSHDSTSTDAGTGNGDDQPDREAPPGPG
jgi:hypothetical protein